MADPLKLDSIEIELGGGLLLMVWGGGISNPDHYDLDQRSADLFRFRAKTSDKVRGGKVPIEYNSEHPSKGALALVLYENTDYRWRVSGKTAASLREGQIDSTIKSPSGRRSLCKWNEEWFDGKAPEGFFRVTNYLGMAEITIGSAPSGRIRFEIQSRKLDYHQEYGAMVEDVAEHCRHLLMEWESPTSFSLARDSGQQSETLLERFLFLRHLMGEEKLEFHLEMIARRPHAALEHEEEWRPAALANPSEFAVNPFRNARGWMRDVPEGTFSVGGVSPSEILHRDRLETHDTPPNRFVLFALTSFRDLCDEIMDEFDDTRGSAWMEASRMRESLDAFLARPFFRDISPLDRLPLESQTLQKREGYRDILQAWLLLDLAAKLDWPGRDEAYDGKNRDAATLYECWLYFILLDVLKSRLMMEPWKKARDKGLFVSAGKNRGVMINLRKGQESVSRLVWKGVDGTEMGVHFFYNRKFLGAPDPKISGSYSKAFWPDYTLAFFPREYMERGDWSEAEEAALKDGKIAYLHFDAKYRLDLIPGKAGPFGNDDEGTLLSEREEAKGCDTYKRGDLYKMHTYNDAIRRTAGSYVLYPGQEGAPTEDFPRYEEVAPGVGAFPLRPGPESQREKCETALAQFIGDVLNHHGNTFSRSYRINYWTHETIKETPASYGGKPLSIDSDGLPATDAEVLVAGYRTPEIALVGRKKGFAYLHAIDKDGNPTKVTPDLLKAAVILPYNFEKDKTPEWCGWFAKITGSRLVSREKLIDNYLRDQSMLGSKTQFYYVIEFEHVREIDRNVLKEVKSILPPIPGIPIRKTWESVSRF
jgi:predicted component of viral defense system (DUF524 family)